MVDPKSFDSDFDTHWEELRKALNLPIPTLPHVLQVYSEFLARRAEYGDPLPDPVTRVLWGRLFDVLQAGGQERRLGEIAQILGQSVPSGPDAVVLSRYYKHKADLWLWELENPIMESDDEDKPFDVQEGSPVKVQTPVITEEETLGIRFTQSVTGAHSIKLQVPDIQVLAGYAPDGNQYSRFIAGLDRRSESYKNFKVLLTTPAAEITRERLITAWKRYSDDERPRIKEMVSAALVRLGAPVSEFPR